VLGEGAIFYGGSERAWASFNKEFAPTNSRVLVVASIVNRGVPQHQREPYREVETWSPTGVQEVHDAIRREIESDEGLRKWLPPNQIPNRLQLFRIDIRRPFHPPAKWILTDQFEPNKPVWYVRIQPCGAPHLIR